MEEEKPKQVDVNLTLKDNYGLFITAKNGSKSILKNIVVILTMSISTNIKTAYLQLK